MHELILSGIPSNRYAIFDRQNDKKNRQPVAKEIEPIFSFRNENLISGV